MSVPLSTTDSSRQATTDVVLELSSSQVPPTLPFQLKDYVTPNTWEIRMSTLLRLASQYSRPTFERAYLVVILVLTFLVPITSYYLALRALQGVTTDIDKQVWLARFSCFAITVATWILLVTPMCVWKYLGKVRVMKLAAQWTKTDALSTPSYGAAPVWKATAPGLFRDTFALTVAVPSVTRSHFGRDSLPSYVSIANERLPSYGDARMVQWSKDLNGGIKYGDLPIYTDDKAVVV